MEEGSRALLCLLVFSAMAASAVVQANIADYDESWQKRRAEAQQAALEAYHPDPHSVNDHINSKVHLALEISAGGGNSTSSRRSLMSLKKKRHGGPCLATNPIDRCWRCDPNWASNRKKLADCVLGFGRNTVGGKYGRYYVVTDASDDDMVNPKPGTLRYAVTRKEPLWITFAHDMIIKLKQELMVASYKTIDGRGANVHVAYGAQITVQFAQHVIIHGIHVHHTVPAAGGMLRDTEDHVGLRTVSDGDAISIFGSSHVWIDHVSMYNCKDGLVDAIEGSTAITISNNHMTKHDHVMLFGASDSYAPDAMMQITVAFNHFGKGLIQRMPRCRLGFFHVLNNDYTHWEMYAIGGSENSTIISEGNRYIAPNDRIYKEVTHRVNPNDPWHSWQWRSHNDLMVNGAFFVQSGLPEKRRFSKQDMITAKDGAFVKRLTRFAGTLLCVPGRPC